MVVSCWVNGCANRANGKDKKVFFSIPAIRENEGDFTRSLTEKRRQLWLANINLRDFLTKYSKICSDHFVSGKPASINDQANPDWIPTLKMSHEMTPSKSMKKQKQVDTDNKRFMKAAERHKTKEKHEVARALLFQQEIPEQDHVAVSEQDDVSVDEKPSKCCTFYLLGKLEKSSYSCSLC